MCVTENSADGGGIVGTANVFPTGVGGAGGTDAGHYCTNGSCAPDVRADGQGRGVGLPEVTGAGRACGMFSDGVYSSEGGPVAVS
jgi:hypothetical protein